MQQDKDIESLSFREALNQLEEIVGSLESSTLDLEESLSYYSKGVALLSYLKEKLSSAEQKVEVLMGELEESVDDDTQDTTLQKA